MERERKHGFNYRAEDVAVAEWIAEVFAWVAVAILVAVFVLASFF
jgi:hypothetical protein